MDRFESVARSFKGDQTVLQEVAEFVLLISSKACCSLAAIAGRSIPSRETSAICSCEPAGNWKKAPWRSLHKPFMDICGHLQTPAPGWW